MERVVILVVPMLLFATTAGAQGSLASSASLRITQRSLRALCMNDAPVQSSARRWTVDTREVRLTVTMHNQPRYMDADAGPAGIATISFRPEAGHRYEVEVRADSGSFARRVWTAGNWRPVVRDRTTEQIVSTAPEWPASPCGPGR
jgi:hypothetical protein